MARDRIAPSWYVDPNDDTRERYWNGAKFIGDPAQLKRNTPPFPGPDNAPISEPREWKSSAREPGQVFTLTGVGIFLRVLAVLTAIGAVVVGVVLIAHTVTSCVTDPYSDYADCTGKIHPWAASGVGALIGGLVQASVLAVVGHLCLEVARMREIPRGGEKA